MNTWEGIDKRKFPRANYECRISVMDQGKEDWFNSLTENIGAGGLCVVLPKEISLFKNAKLEIFLTGSDKPLLCSGMVVWVIRRKSLVQSGGYDYDTGIEFTDIEENDKAKIALLVDDILSA